MEGADRGDVMPPSSDRWPELPYAAWKDTCQTLQLWTQIVGKIRLARTPWLNHSWHVALYVTARGLTTSPMPDGSRTFQIDFDFIDHRLVMVTSDGAREVIPLTSMSIADFHAEVMARLAALKIDVKIWPVPTEVVDATPFTERTTFSEYRPEVANRLWHIFS